MDGAAGAPDAAGVEPVRAPTPHLLDTVREAPLQVDPKAVLRGVAELRPRAQRFVFGADASYFLGRFVAEFDLHVLDNVDFAIPPYPVTYVEYDTESFIRGLGRSRTSGEGMACGKADRTVGYLIDTEESAGADGPTYRVLTLLRNGRVYPVGWSWGKRSVRGPSDVVREHDVVDKYVLGSTFDRASDVAKRESSHRVGVHTPWNDQLVQWGRLHVRGQQLPQRQLDTLDKLGTLMASAAGEPRTLWAMLLLLNRRGVAVDQVARAAHLYKGRRVVYAAHNVVNLTLGTEPAAAHRRVVASISERASPRRHEVRGHFVHRGVDPGAPCVHDWVERSPRRWQCDTCGAWRTWREAHERGDAGKGYATKEYAAAPAGVS